MPPIRFKRFSRKRYALFAVLHREVLIGVLAVSTLTHAKADGIATTPQANQGAAARSDIDTEQQLDELTVNGTLAPLTAAQTPRPVAVITRQDIAAAAATTVNDLLKTLVNVDVRQRGPFAVQTDITIDGGTHDQIAFLINGVSVGNPQTGHLTPDFPVALSDIDHIKILAGAASRVYGPAAFRGAINIVTVSPQHSAPIQGGQALPSSAGTAQHQARSGDIRLQTGSYGTLAAEGALRAERYSVSAAYRRTDGGTPNSDFRRAQAYVQLAPVKGLAVDAGFNTQDFVANTFYSPAYPDQHEATSRLFATARYALATGPLTLRAHAAANRSWDHYQLIADSPRGENYHRTTTLEAAATASLHLAAAGTTTAAVNIRREAIASTNLGHPEHPDDFYPLADRRTNLALYLEHTYIYRALTVAAGCVANRSTGYDSRLHLYPGVDIAVRPTARLAATLSWNTALRLPTFTDLYYKSPTQQGNVGLQPERTQSLRATVSGKPIATANTSLLLKAEAFADWGRDMIDWVMFSPDDIYHSQAFALNNYGYNVGATLAVPRFTLAAAYQHQYQRRLDDTPVYRSCYALEYLRHKATATATLRLTPRYTLSAAWRWQQRRTHTAYHNIDLKATARYGRLTVDIDAINVTSQRHTDVAGVPQPGFWLLAAATVKL